MVLAMEQKMTWKEIKKTFPDEWVAISDFEEKPTSNYEMISGEVIAHSKNEMQFTKELKKIASKKTVDIRFTGELLPDNPVGPVLWQISDTSS